MTSPYRKWLEQHLKDATKQYRGVQRKNRDSDYEDLHTMWGYLSGLEKCLKELKAREKPGATQKRRPNMKVAP